YQCDFFFLINDTPTPEIYTLSLHDALPIYSSRVTVSVVSTRLRRDSSAFARRSHPISRGRRGGGLLWLDCRCVGRAACDAESDQDRKSTRLNSSHSQISYAVFCLKKKKTKQ